MDWLTLDTITVNLTPDWILIKMLLSNDWDDERIYLQSNICLLIASTTLPCRVDDDLIVNEGESHEDYPGGMKELISIELREEPDTGNKSANTLTKGPDRPIISR